MIKTLLKNIIVRILVVTFLLISSVARSDEGMWLPHLLKSMNESDMKASGLKLSAEDIYSINQSSLKDAIVSFGGFCTGEMISAEGLLLTNHHCGFGQIQHHSSEENDYLENGFWAMKRGEELPNEGLSASFLVSIEDVTNVVLEELGDIREELRPSLLRNIFDSIVTAKIEGTNYNARVKPFFGGNEFYLMTYITYNDVRLVGAPPSSIGKFGGDTDNWMWPRHTGDFALFRIYCDKEGNPSEYSKDNIPYNPKHHLPIQLDGVSNGDYTMIYGFPGGTDRYLTSHGVELALDESNPTIVKIRDKKLKIMKKGMDASKKTKLQYASKYARTSNYWKYYIGQSKGLKRMNVFDEKSDIEQKFSEWVNDGNESREKKYGDALNLIKEAYEDQRKANLSLIYFFEAIWQGPEILRFSYQMHRYLRANSSDGIDIDEVLEMKDRAKDFYKDYNTEIDRELFSAMLEMYYDNVSVDDNPIFQKIDKQLEVQLLKLIGVQTSRFDVFSKNVFNTSIFSSEEKFLSFLENSPSLEKIEKDLAYTTFESFLNRYFSDQRNIISSSESKLEEGNRLFIAGLREMNPEKKYYPDANSTLRLTYGNVADYFPGDAMHYDYFTTIDGIIEKEDPNNEEFFVDPKLKSLYEIGDYGRYADKDGNLRVNFISNNDITGGNSGSPVMNAWGEIVGTAFDGNWEAMSGDIAFENEIQRTISVDIRYIMFIIDKFAGATHLIDEMTIAESHIDD